MIYLIATECNNFCKIGFTKGDPFKRLQMLQCGCPLNLRLVDTIDAGIIVENIIHHSLIDHRVRGEWFKFNEDVLGHFQNVKCRMADYEQ